MFSYSSLYAEDGKYLSNIINKGFIKSSFATRSGKSNDFYNLGSYILLGLSLIVNKIFCGYDLRYFPMIMGIVSSFFYAIVSVYCFYVFNKKNTTAAALIYCACIFMPLNDSGMEIYGRVLNLVFLFPMLSMTILFSRWEKKYTFSIRDIMTSVILLICGLTFPISFVPIGIWLILGMCHSLKYKKIKCFIKYNLHIYVVLIIGFLILPVMLGSQGSAAGLAIKKESLIEFLVARHCLYPIVYLWYRELNNLIVITVFILTLLVLTLAMRKLGYEYFVLVSMSIISILASAVMRLPMTSLFESYGTTYPDRYYYGCNIMYCTIFLYGLTSLIKQKRILNFLLAVVVSTLLINDNLFPIIGISNKYLTGSSEDIQWTDCLEKSYYENNIENGKYLIDCQPAGWSEIELPIQYVWSSVQ